MTVSDPDVVVVTGANGGIGLPMTARLAESGYRVAALDVELDELNELAEARPDLVTCYECDVTETDRTEAVVDAVLEDHGRIDILVNNAAIFDFGPFEATDLEEFRRGFEVNYFGYLRMIRAVLPHMRDRGRGIIHNVSSGTGVFGQAGMTRYASTKGAVEMLTKSLRLELRGEEIWCTVMHPPLTRTEAADELQLGYPDWILDDPDEVGRNLADRIEETGPVVTPDWTTRLTLTLLQWFPFLLGWATDRYVDLDE